MPSFDEASVPIAAMAKTINVTSIAALPSAQAAVAHYVSAITGAFCTQAAPHLPKAAQATNNCRIGNGEVMAVFKTSAHSATRSDDPRLGKLLQTFTISAKPRVLFFVAGVVTLALGAWAMVENLEPRPGSWAGLLGAGGAFSGAGWLFYVGTRSQFLRIFERGFVYRAKTIRPVHAAHSWQDVKRVQMVPSAPGSTMLDEPRYLLIVVANGQSYALSELIFSDLRSVERALLDGWASLSNTPSKRAAAEPGHA